MTEKLVAELLSQKDLESLPFSRRFDLSLLEAERPEAQRRLAIEIRDRWEREDLLKIEHGVGINSIWEDISPPMEIMKVEANTASMEILVECDDGSKWKYTDIPENRINFETLAKDLIAAQFDRDHFYCLEGRASNCEFIFNRIRKIPVFASWSAYTHHHNGGLVNGAPSEWNMRPSLMWKMQGGKDNISLQILINRTETERSGRYNYTTPVSIVTYRDGKSKLNNFRDEIVLRIKAKE